MNYEGFFNDFQKLVKKHEKAAKPKNPITDPEKKAALLERLAKGREAKAVKKSDAKDAKDKPKPSGKRTFVKM